MTQFATATDFTKLWTQSGQVAERKLLKYLLVGLDEVGREMSDVPAKIKVGKALTSPVARWMEEPDYPSKVTATLSTTTMTFSGSLFNAAINAAALNQCIRAGTYLQRPSF